MRKHDREPSERRAPQAPSRAPPSRSRPGAAGGSGASRARTCPRHRCAARPERAGCSRLRAPTPGRLAAARRLTPLPVHARPAAIPPRLAQTRTFRAAGGPPLAAAARPELAPLRPRRSPPSRFPRRRGPPVPPRLSPRPAATAMVVSGRGGGGGSGGGDGTRGCRGWGRGRAARHLPGVRPRGASPARRCESAGGSGGAERALPCAVQVNVVQATSPGALGRLPRLSVLLPDRTVWQQRLGGTREKLMSRGREKALAASRYPHR
ncbi:uncharacterized protein GJ701_006888 [Geothlypis trichas]